MRSGEGERLEPLEGTERGEVSVRVRALAKIGTGETRAVVGIGEISENPFSFSCLCRHFSALTEKEMRETGGWEKQE